MKYIYIVTVEGINAVGIYGIYSNLKLAKIKAKEAVLKEHDKYNTIKITKILFNIDSPENAIKTIIIRKGRFH